MNDWEISGNTAIRGGGVYVYVEANYGDIKKQPASGSSTSGVVYGYTTGDVESNKVVNSSGVVQTGKGHAVYVYVSSTKKRDTTVGETELLDSDVDGAEGGWE